MYLKAHKRSATVTKVLPFDNILLSRLAFAAVILFNFYANRGFGAEIPVSIMWPGSHNQETIYVIEVSDDAHFGTSLLKTEVKASQFAWQAPKEGVYHWRVTPKGRTADGTNHKGGIVESSSFASGSFVAIDDQTKTPAEVPLKWSAVEGVTAYHLKVQKAGAPSTALVSLKNEFVVTRQAAPLVIEVLPRTTRNTSRVAPDAIHHFDPGLVIVKPEPVKEPVRELVVGEWLPPQEPAAPSLAALPPPPAAVEWKEREFIDDGFPDERVSELSLSVYGGTEKTSARKGSVLERTSKGVISGGAVSLRAAPVVGLSLMAQLDGHGREANWRDRDGLEAGSQPVTTYVGQVGLGFDTFFATPTVATS